MKQWWISGLLILLATIAYNYWHDHHQPKQPDKPVPSKPKPAEKIKLLMFDQLG